MIFKNIAESVGFHTSFQASNLEEILICLNQMRESNHPSFLEIIIKPGYRPDLGRPIESPSQNKLTLMKKLLNY